MSIANAIQTLSTRYEVVSCRDGGVEFLLDGYSVEFHDRGDHALTVTFLARMPEKWKKPATARTGWGYEFLKKQGVSALHIKSDRNTWYRLPSIRTFFEAARDVGLFGAFDHVTTYGTSMGGFGALSFAGIAGADVAIAYNPQINLGPSVRAWETRFNSAMQHTWDDDLCDVDLQISRVALPVVIYDPFYLQDRKQVELLESPHLLRLRVPFVGHHMPDHLLAMKMLGWLYAQCRDGAVDEAEFYRRARDRRTLLRYRNVMLAAAAENPKRHARLDALLPAEALLGGD